MPEAPLNWNGEQLLALIGSVAGRAFDDVVVVSADGARTALGTGIGTFGAPGPLLAEFGTQQGWRAESHPRSLADTTGDGRADLVGFGDHGVWTALSNGDGTFRPSRLACDSFGHDQAWRVEEHVRLLADVTGDGRSDVIGFGAAGVWTALSDGAGSFAAPGLTIGFGNDQGWRVERHPRLVADLTGDGRADLVGFGIDGVWTALSNGDGTFAPPRLVLSDLGETQGWRVDKHVRVLADLTGDGTADIVGCGQDGVWTALSLGDGTFSSPRLVLRTFGYDAGRWRTLQHPRFAADLTGNGRADLIGFGAEFVWTALSNGDGTFGTPQRVPTQFSYRKGWRVGPHLRLPVDLSGDGTADIIGFGADGVRTALADGSGSFHQDVRALDDRLLPKGMGCRVIDLSYLQSKFDVFFNDRVRPLFQVRLDNPEHTFGTSTAAVAVDTNKGEGPQYDFDHPAFTKELDELGFSLPFGLGNFEFYFQDLNTDRFTLHTVGGLAFALNVHFETAGNVEIKVDGHTGHDIHLDALNITLRPELGVRGNRLDLFGFVDEIERTVDEAVVTSIFGSTSGGVPLPDPVRYDLSATFRGEDMSFSRLSTQGTTRSSGELMARDQLRRTLGKRFIATDASVTVAVWPDGAVRDGFQDQFDAKIYDAFRLDPDPTKNKLRDGLSSTLTTWLVGGPFDVTDVSADDQSVTIAYTVPPGGLEPFPETAQPPLDPGRLAGIDHIVVLMMENRSFDHMLGYLSLAPELGGRGRTDIDGFKSGALPSNRYLGQDYPAFLVTDPGFVHQTPPHGPEPVLAQIGGGQMSGFISAFARQYDVDGEQARAVMSYYGAATLDVYDQLAAEFLICDRWFCAHPGPTFCNRFYTLTGRLNRDADGNPQPDNFHGADFVPVQTKTVFDHLSDRGVSWRYYEQRYSTIRLYAKYTFDHDHVLDFKDPVDGFFAAAAAGTLPAVTFIDPNFIDEPDEGDNDDAAPGNLSRGQVLVGGIVDALVRSPAWNRTMFVLTYDEHGGFFDHLNPMAPEFRSNATPVSGLDFYGVRVPTFVVSPWVERGAASHVVFDHTSIVKTIIRRFMSAQPPDMGSRVAAANDLSSVLLDAPRSTDFEMVAARRVDDHQPPSPEPASGTSTEFKDVMRYLRDQARSLHAP